MTSKLLDLIMSLDRVDLMYKNTVQFVLSNANEPPPKRRRLTGPGMSKALAESTNSKPPTIPSIDGEQVKEESEESLTEHEEETQNVNNQQEKPVLALHSANTQILQFDIKESVDCAALKAALSPAQMRITFLESELYRGNVHRTELLETVKTMNEQNTAANVQLNILKQQLHSEMLQKARDEQEKEMRKKKTGKDLLAKCEEIKNLKDLNENLKNDMDHRENTQKRKLEEHIKREELLHQKCTKTMDRVKELENEKSTLKATVSRVQMRISVLEDVCCRQAVHTRALLQRVTMMNEEKTARHVQLNLLNQQWKSEMILKQQSQREMETLKGDLLSKDKDLKKQQDCNDNLVKQLDECKRDYQQLADILLCARSYANSVPVTE